MSSSKSRPCLLQFSHNGFEYNIQYASISQAQKAMVTWLKKSNMKDAKISITR